jgi:exodeoxyribonuclease VII small subunit
LSLNPDEPRSFETAYRELQQVVTQLESGSLDLDRALDLVERGDRLAAICRQIVDDARLRVTRLAAETASPLSETAGPG